MNRPDDRLPAAVLDLGLVPADRPLPLVLEHVAGLATEVLGGQPALSVTVVGPGGGCTTGTTAQVAAALDELQYRAGAGPCLTAATTGELSVVADTGTDRRWPALAAAAADAGRRAVLSVPFPTDRRVAGGLNLYLQWPVPAEGPRREQVERFARHAVVPVANASLHGRTARRAEDLQAALRSRAVLDRATGILVERFGMTAEEATRALARVSDETGTDVRDVAEHLVGTGAFPPG